MLKRLYRLKNTKDIKRALNGNNKQTSSIAVIKSANNQLEHSRFTVIISKKISKKATERNRAKRQVKAIIKKNLNLFKKKIDYVIIIRKPFLEKSFNDIENILLNDFKSLRIINGEEKN